MKQYLALVLVKQKEETRRHRAQFCLTCIHVGYFTMILVCHKWSLMKRGLSSRAEGRDLTKMPLTALYFYLSEMSLRNTLVIIMT